VPVASICQTIMSAVVLRAAAPLFVPSSSSIGNNKDKVPPVLSFSSSASASSTSQVVGDEISSKTPKRRNRNRNRKTKQTKSQPPQQLLEQSHDESTVFTNSSIVPTTTTTSRGRRRPVCSPNKRNPEDARQQQQQQQQQQQHLPAKSTTSSTSSKGGGGVATQPRLRQRRQRQHKIQPVDHLSTNNKQEDESRFLLDHGETAFPSLRSGGGSGDGGNPNATTAAAAAAGDHGDDDPKQPHSNHPFLLAEAWQNITHPPQPPQASLLLLQQQQQQCLNTFSGLQKLTLSKKKNNSNNGNNPTPTRSEQASSQAQVRLPSNEQEEDSKNNNNDDDSSSCHSELLPISHQGQRRRRHYNMDRLRNRWWHELAHSSRKQHLQAEWKDRLQQIRLHSKNEEVVVEVEVVEGKNKEEVEEDKKEEVDWKDTKQQSSPSTTSSSSTSTSSSVEVAEEEEFPKPQQSDLLFQEDDDDDDDDDEQALVALSTLLLLEKDAEKTSYSVLLQRAMERNDKVALQTVLSFLWNNNNNNNNNTHESSPLHMAIQLDKPQLIPIIVSFMQSSSTATTTTNGNNGTTPLMLAAELGHEECLSLLLQLQLQQTEKVGLLSAKDASGNNVFHYACRATTSTTTTTTTTDNKWTLSTLLQHASTSGGGGSNNKNSSSTKAQQQYLAKLLLTKNNEAQTPLHVACQHGRIELVETFLATCSSTLLSKMLASFDDSHQIPLLAAVAANATHVVMCLIMWRGNHHHRLTTANTFFPPAVAQQQQQVPAICPPCPLVWAAKAGNLEMILLLLEFSDPSGTEYKITEALHECLLCESVATTSSGSSSSSNDTTLECIHVLVQAGANPFEEIHSPCGLSNGNLSKSAVTIAALSCGGGGGGTEWIPSLVASGRQALQERQQARRQTPNLRQQPETFFAAIELKENHEMTKALGDALVKALMLGYTSSSNKASMKQQDIRLGHLAAAATLYRMGAQLRDEDLLRLRSSLVTGELLLQSDVAVVGLLDRPSTLCSFLAIYPHPIGPDDDSSKLNDLEIDRSVLSHWSRRLCQMPWMREMEGKFGGSSCAWLSSADERDKSIADDDMSMISDQLVLVANDGTRFLVHGSLLSKKSAKLAAAIRFAKMNPSETSDCGGMRVVNVGIEPHLCRWMLQHMYHGSITCGWSRNNEQNCRELLELLLIAEEFLCWTLVQECEMRLLAGSSPRLCYCWSCAKAVRCRKADQSKDEDEDDKTLHAVAECMYHVDGNASQLVTAGTALDVLAVLQHLESTMEMEYSLQVVPMSFPSLKCLHPKLVWPKYDNNNNSNNSSSWKSTKAITALKDLSMCAILKDFFAVVQGDAYRENAENNCNNASPLEENELVPQALLLQMCLEELAASPISFLDNEPSKHRTRKSECIS
jgi:hypothetical protein